MWKRKRDRTVLPTTKSVSALSTNGVSVGGVVEETVTLFAHVPGLSLLGASVYIQLYKKTKVLECRI